MSSVKQAPKPLLIGSPLLAGVVFSLIWLGIGALFLSFMLHFTNMKESELGTYALLVHVFSALAGGFTSGKRSERKGWYNGGTLGLFYGIIVIIVSFLAADATLSWDSVLMLGSALLSGILGGVVGVNLKK
ncbi:TIGR04086 family membrane protein [Paenibacillus sp. GSMTC-2017]|uniref:TIGR04086 family membrane protein n=1 Tax=Paenibacillus sp. GSMTC-2017 TaxID=2794350 RepID=UPI0018D5EDDD|nr:TIGR04086 family membrane protein [Paenibacillus sp. GSMTC-2017]MBH5317128.1 TIGR04086 family membrane protein [Paenibacillus sp. GSMTC-2017]